MSIFGDIAKTFSPKSKAPTLDALERLERDAAAAVEAARKAYEALEAKRPEAILAGDEARLAHRSAMTAAKDDLSDAEAAHAAVVARLEQAKVEAVEKGRQEAYARAAAAQRAAADAILADYSTARDTLLRLQRLVAEADAAAEPVNAALPSGAAPLPRECESLVRDRPGQEREVISSEVVELWTGEGGAPVADQASVRSRDGRSGSITVSTGFGPHGLPVRKQAFERRRVRPWIGATYGARLADLELPPLCPEAPPAAGEVEELEPVAPPAVAAE